MTEVLGIALGSWLLAVITWLFYLAIMHLLKVYKDLHPVAKAHAFLLLIVGLAFDVVLNVVLATAVFLDPPRELLLTSRLKRYRRVRQNGWRRRTAVWICEHLLNQFDSGHC